MRGLARGLCAFGVDRALRWWRRKKLVVLMYHGVVDEALSPFCWHQLPLPAFHRQMQWIARHYRVLPLEDALERLRAGRLPRRACAITFDDGYESVATKALPVLEELDLTATVFLPTDLHGEGALTWPDRVWLALAHTPEAPSIPSTLARLKAMPTVEREREVEALERARAEQDAPRPDPAPFALLRHETVRALAAKGRLAFGPHSRTHPILSRCDDARVRDEVQGSIEAMRAIVPDPVRVFAYPNGRAQDFDERARSAVRQAGLEHALSTVEGLVDPGSDPLALPRVCVGADLSFERFRLLCGGL